MGQMKAQIPAVGILKRSDYGDCKSYQIVCECHDPDHDHNVWIESEDTGVSVTTYTTQKTRVWELNRWQTIWRLLTRGYVEYQASIIMTEQQALNYAETLKTAVSDVKNFRKTSST
jgi:hypothetical protein